MKKIFISLLLLLAAAPMYAVHGERPSGTWLTEDFNTKQADNLIQVTYTFTEDSLFVDAYPSGCGIATMSIQYVNYEYIATETLYNQETGEPIQKRVYHLLFLPCRWDKNSLAVYRDGVVVDIIKKIP